MHTNTGSSGQGDTDTILYTAPASYSNPITITATSVENPSSSDSDTFTVLGGALSVSTSSLPSGAVGVAYASTTLQATGGTPPYSWSIVSGSLPPGLTLANGAISGTPTAAGTFAVTLQVTDSLGATASASLSIVINTQSASDCGAALGHESARNGQYAFLLQGFDSKGATAIAGSFTADGTGKITAGEEDINSNIGAVAQNFSLNAASSFYTLGSDNRGCLNFSTSAGTFIYRFAIRTGPSGVAVKGFLIAFDTSTVRVDGVFEKQDPSAFSNAQINGNYTFGVASSLSGAGRFAAVGSFSASAGVLSAGSLDTNKSGDLNSTGTSTYPANPLSFTGTYSISASGRGTILLNVAGKPVNGILYAVSSSELFLMRSDDQSQSLFAGRVIQQSSAPFSNSSLNGASVRYLGGLTSSGTDTRLELGLFTVSVPGSFSYSADLTDSDVSSHASASGTYSVDSSTARVSLTVSASNPPICYLSAPNQAFCMSTNSLVSFGETFPQSSGPYSNSSLSGSYAFSTVQPAISTIYLQSGVSAISSPGNFAYTVDNNFPGHPLVVGKSGALSYSLLSNGTAVDPASGSAVEIFYVISPARFIMIDANTTAPNLYFFEK